jgi:2-amino-4-hydroxy-6-hydroxymethyldihydropteridine diphosphokinase
MEGVVHHSPTLNIPHSHLEERRFALIPLAEIAGDVKHPVSGLSINEILAQCTDKGEVKDI